MSSIKNITNNEDYVRMRIYDGDLQVSEAARELINLERSQRDSEIAVYRSRLDHIYDLYEKLLKMKEDENVN